MFVLKLVNVMCYHFLSHIVSLSNLISLCSNHISPLKFYFIVFFIAFSRTGSGALKALHSGLQSVISVASTGRADISVIPGQMLTFGTRTLTVLATPGHTEVCINIVW